VKTLKYALILSIIVAVGFGVNAAVTGIYDSGYNAAVVDFEKANDTASKVEDGIVAGELTAAIEQNKNERDGALKLNEVIKADAAALEVAFNDLQKIQATHSCTRLGADYVRVFNEFVGHPPESVPRTS
jgi:hypothetical protein